MVKMSVQEQFDTLVAKVPTEKAREIFKRIGQKDLHKWNSHSFQMMTVFSSLSYEEIAKDSYLRASFLTSKLPWLYYVNDPTFVELCKKFSEKDLEKLSSDDREIIKCIQA